MISSVTQQSPTAGYIPGEKLTKEQIQWLGKRICEDLTKIRAEAAEKLSTAKFKAAESGKIVEQGRQQILVSALESTVLYGKDCRQSKEDAQITNIFDKYLRSNESSITYERDGHKDLLHSMGPVIALIKDNPDADGCDFRRFKQHVGDIPSLLSFVKTTERIKLLAFSKELAATLTTDIEKQMIDLKTSRIDLKVVFQ